MKNGAAVSCGAAFVTGDAYSWLALVPSSALTM
jgi:hypothetical protein